MLRGSLVLVSLLALAASAAHADDDLLVDLRDDTSDADARAIEALADGTPLHLNSPQAREERFFVGDVPRERLAAVIARLRADPRVEHAEENVRFQASFVPDDPRYGEQWSFRMVGAERAWAVARGRGVVVAVIDTGIRQTLEDLAEASFTPGFDFIHDRVEADDDHGHGSHVAGTIAQVTGNGRGVAGLAFEATLMPVKVLDANGSGTAADIADAIRFAADEGARVLNLSLGGGSRSETVAAAVAYARKKGVLVVCAAGNGGRGVVEYPAAYPGAIAVSAVGPDGRLAPYSSYGPEVAVAAPGGDTRQSGGGVLQNTIDRSRPSGRDHYAAFQGTSMATPHVSAALALILSAGVTDADAAEALLRGSARAAEPGARDPRFGDGLLDAGAALEKASRASGEPLALLLAALGTLALRRRQLGFSGWIALVVAASGAWFVRPWLGTSVFTSAVPAWDRFVLGASWAGTAVFWSPLPVLVLTLLALASPRARGPLIGLALGWAAFLLVGAGRGDADVVGVPGSAGLLDRAWLLGSALLLVGLARLVSLRRESR